MGTVTAMVLKNVIKRSAIGAVKRFACQTCGTIASVSMVGNAVKVSPCACVRASKAGN